MNPVITEHQAEIAEICRRHKILRLEAFDLLDRSPPEDPYEVGFAAEFAQIASPGYYRQVVDLEEDLGKVLNRRVWISGLPSLKNDASNDNPEALRILKEMEPVYGNGKSTATSRSTGSAAAA